VRLFALILAAGEGRRMGGPKALLPAGERTFLAHAAALLDRPGVERVVAVLGHEAARVAALAGLPASVITVVNEGYRAGMLSSLLRGLAASEAAGATALLVHPVDHPLALPASVDRVIAALRDGATVAAPSWSGRRGHPTGFAAAAFPALRAADPQRGARVVLAEHPEWVAHVEGDPGCLVGLDTPAEYERAFGRPPSFLSP
jgi:CTP:molybdopterin cytidylyltransferase MocA